MSLNDDVIITAAVKNSRREDTTCSSAHLNERNKNINDTQQRWIQKIGAKIVSIYSFHFYCEEVSGQTGSAK